MIARLALLCCTLLIPFLTVAQTHNVTGRVIDAKDTSGIIGASVTLINKADTNTKTGNVTDENGRFTIPGIAVGQYTMRLDYLGYKQVTKSLNVVDADVDAGTISMTTTTNELKGVTVTAAQIAAEQKGDTTQFNAGAYKTNPDATAEDLLTKMPGITSDATGVKVNGETVQQVYVDGKPFFGTDPGVAMKNLPAEVIDKIQVFDKLSDQSNFTGFDDGNAQKTINIITKKGKSNGVFGKVYGGYGTDERYAAGGNLNIFNGDRRITLLGLSNNINQQNFSSEDVLGIAGGSGQNRGGGGRGGSRGGGSNNFMTGQQGGITNTNSFGINYSDNWGEKIKVTGSYFFNNTQNTSNTDIVRNYFTSPDSTNVYRENDNAVARNFNHRANLRFEYNIDSFNSLTFTPAISFQQNNKTSNMFATDSIADALSSSTLNRTDAFSNGYNGSGNLLYQHKFRKPRRTVSVNIASTVSEKGGNGTYLSDNEFYSFDTTSTIRDQHYDLYNNSYNGSANLSYTEPIGKNGQLMFSYNPSITESHANKATFNRDTTLDEYTVLDPRFSNRYDNTYTTQKGGISYRLGGGGRGSGGDQKNNTKTSFNIGTNVQYATLDGVQVYPNSLSINRSFTTVLPNAMFNHRWTDGRNLRLMYRTNTQAPSVSQLQNVIDVTNPLLLKSGNAALNQDFEQTFIVRYGLTKTKTSRNFFLNVYATYINDYIGNATYAPISGDSLYTDPVTNTDVIINRGAQLTKPVNVDGFVNLRTFLTYGTPISAIKCNINLNGGFNFTRTPGIINGTTNYSNNYTPSFGLVLSSNISENIDFTLSYSGSYNIVQNTVQAQANNNYYNHATSLRFNYIFLRNFVFNTSITENYYSGFSSTGSQDFYLWNAYVAYKMLKSRALEVRLTAFDILKQNRSISRTVTETYIENNVTQVLQQYFMLQLTYTIRNFKGTMPTQDNDADDHGSRPSGDRPSRDRAGRGGPPPGGGGF